MEYWLAEAGIRSRARGQTGVSLPDGDFCERVPARFLVAQTQRTCTPQNIRSKNEPSKSKDARSLKETRRVSGEARGRPVLPGSRIPGRVSTKQGRRA